jgi:hypothetical protein
MIKALAMIKFFKMALLFLSIAHGEISFQAIKGIHHTVKEKKPIFKEGYDHLSPIWGFLDLKTGMIENLRFFGNYEFGWNEKDPFKREYSKDNGQDGITKLVRILFPSTGGQLATVAVGASNNLGQYLTPDLVGKILNGIQKLRKENVDVNFDLKFDGKPSFNDINKLFYNDKLEGKEGKDKFQDGLKQLFQKCLQDEKEGLYPEHTTEHIVLAFLWSHFNTKNDIKKIDLLRKLNIL